MIKRLEWDSAFFGLEIAERTLYGEAGDEIPDFDLIYVKQSSANLLPMQGFENKFSEKRVVYSKRLENKEVICDSIVSVAGSDKIDGLYELAYESGKHSRFNLDKNFGNDNFRKLYDRWIDNSLNGLFADDILIYENEGKAIGMVTYKAEKNYAAIGLIAVAPGHQGMGIGKKLLDCVEARLTGKGIFELRIPTQESNISACSFYENRGYSVLESHYIMHYWKI